MTVEKNVETVAVACKDCGCIFSKRKSATKKVRCDACQKERDRKSTALASAMSRARRDSKKPVAITQKRKCHSCGKLTYDFECEKCREKRNLKGI